MSCSSWQSTLALPRTNSTSKSSANSTKTRPTTHWKNCRHRDANHRHHVRANRAPGRYCLGRHPAHRRAVPYSVGIARGDHRDFRRRGSNRANPGPRLGGQSCRCRRRQACPRAPKRRSMHIGRLVSFPCDIKPRNMAGGSGDYPPLYSTDSPWAARPMPARMA